MALLIGIALLIAALIALYITFISAARLDDQPFSLDILSSKQFWKIYLFGSYYVTGKSIRPRYGLALVFLTIALYPASYSMDHRFTGDTQTIPYFIIARLLSLLGPFCAWPATAYFADSALIAIQNQARLRATFLFLAAFLTLTMFCFHFLPLMGFWPPFISDYLVF